MLSLYAAKQSISRGSVRCFSVSSARFNSPLFPKLESITQADLTLQKPSTTNATENTASSSSDLKVPAGDKEWYYISRSRSEQLPVYCKVRANGHRSTIIRKIQGSTPLLKSDLMAILGFSKDDIKIKQTSNQIVIKGDHVRTIKSLLTAAQF